MTETPQKSTTYSSLHFKEYRYYLLFKFLLTFGVQMQSLVVGWQIYEISKDPLSLGIIGIAEAIPFFCIALFAGHFADHYDRKRIIVLSSLLYLVCAVALAAYTQMYASGILLSTIPVYLVILVTGFARGLMWPALNAFGTQLIPREIYGNAATVNSLAWQIAAVGGPAIGGLICGFYGNFTTYLAVIALSGIGLLFILLIPGKPIPEKREEESIFKSLTAGIRFVFKNQIILSAISLDMFAVFFGGAICILPMFADQVLHIDAKGLGLLRAAPAIGASMMSVFLIYFPPFKQAGKNLLIGVAGFGIATILFALSNTFALAAAALFLTGVFDNISLVIRSTILQVFTPDEMRGRVSSVNSIFIGSSNELGSFESGAAAKLMGLIPSILFGGSITLAIVAVVGKFAPKLRKLRI